MVYVYSKDTWAPKTGWANWKDIGVKNNTSMYISFEINITGDDTWREIIHIMQNPIWTFSRRQINLIIGLGGANDGEWWRDRIYVIQDANTETSAMFSWSNDYKIPRNEIVKLEFAFVYNYFVMYANGKQVHSMKWPIPPVKMDYDGTTVYLGFESMNNTKLRNVTFDDYTKQVAVPADALLVAPPTTVTRPTKSWNFAGPNWGNNTINTSWDKVGISTITNMVISFEINVDKYDTLRQILNVTGHPYVRNNMITGCPWIGLGGYGSLDKDGKPLPDGDTNKILVAAMDISEWLAKSNWRVVSKTQIPLNKPTKVDIVFKRRFCMIFINGALDASFEFPGNLYEPEWFTPVSTTDAKGGFTFRNGTISDYTNQYANHIDKIGSQFKMLDKKYDASEFSFTSFLPSSSALSSSEIAVIGTGADNKAPAIQTDKLPGLHTKETCEFNAGLRMAELKFQEKDNIRKGLIKKVPGLFYKHFPDHQWSLNKKSGDYMKHAVPDKTGMVTEFTWSPSGNGEWTTFKNNNMGYDKFPDYTSAEFFGYIFPDQDGIWSFSMLSDDDCFVWIGDLAINGYTYENATLGYPWWWQQMAPIEIPMKKGEYYPIRIQYMEWWGWNYMVLGIIPPDKSTWQRWDVLHTLMIDNDNPYVANQIYYSLVQNSEEDTKNKMFQCHLIDPKKSDNDSKITDLSYKRFLPMWGYYTKADNEYVDVKSDFITRDQVAEDNYLALDDVGNFNLYNKSGTKVSTILASRPYNCNTTLENGENNGNDVCMQYYDKYQEQIDQWIRQNNPTDATGKKLDLRGAVQMHWKKVGCSSGLHPIHSYWIWTWADAGNVWIQLWRRGSCNLSWCQEFVNQIWFTYPTDHDMDVTPDDMYRQSNGGWWGFTTLYRDLTKNRTDFASNYPDFNQSDRVTKDRPLIFKPYARGCLTFTPAGNLVVRMAKRIEKIKVGDSEGKAINATTKPYNFAINSVHVDEKFNKMFYVDGHDKTAKYVPASSQVLTPGTDYSYVGNYSIYDQTNNPATMASATTGTMPSVGVNSLKGQVKTGVSNLSDCNQFCNNDATCSHFQFQTMKNGSKRCVNMSSGKTDNLIPSSVYMPTQKEGDVASSEIYVRNKKINLSEQYMPTPVAQKYVDTKKGMDIYSKYTMAINPMMAPENVGIGAKPDYQATLDEQHKMLFGQNTPTKTEGFGPYDPTTCSVGDEGCIAAIRNKKLGPLSDLASSISSKLTQMQDNSNDLDNKIKTYNDIRSGLIKDPTSDFAKDMSIKTNNGNAVVAYYIPPDPTLTDGMNEDVNQLMLQENTTYILGTMAAATLLISGIMFASK